MTDIHQIRVRPKGSDEEFRPLKNGVYRDTDYARMMGQFLVIKLGRDREFDVFQASIPESSWVPVE